MAQCIVAGLQVSYDDSGSGPCVVLLHGWGDTRHTFDSLIASLRHFRVVRLDLPGFGESQAPNTPFTLADFAEHVANFLNKIDAKKVYGLIGHSNGGAIALKAVATKQIHCERLILLASSGIRTPHSTRSKLLRISAKAAKVPTKLLPATTQKRLRKKAYTLMGSDLFIAEHLQETFKLVVNEDLTEVASEISTPTLLLYGSEDTATPPSYGKKFAERLQDAQLVIFPSSGHFIHHDKSVEVSQKVMEFLQ